MSLNEKVRAYWEQEACGTETKTVGQSEKLSREWFERIETVRYRNEGFIHSIAQFTRHHGKKILEVGVGAGTDHLQWARAGAKCHGVDLTDEAIRVTRARLDCYGFSSELRRLDAETLPYEDASFDLVYSWGVIHHSERPEAILREIDRVLKSGGEFVGMFYNRHSVNALRLWIYFALLHGKPFQTLGTVVWNHLESIGTKAYTVPELKQLLSLFSQVEVTTLLTVSDTNKFPHWIRRWFPADWGWFHAVRAVKKG